MREPPANVMLVLGGSGFLGAHVVASALCAEGCVVHTASRAPLAALAPIVPVARATGTPSEARFHAVDALRAGEIEALCDALAPATLIVCSSLARIADCAAYPGLARALNTELPRRLARWSAGDGARLVCVSTDLVFGAVAPPAGGFGEEDPPAPVSVYGRTKAEGERAALDMDPEALIVRLPLLYGPSHGRGLGASDALLAALERGEQPVLFSDEWRTPLDARDAADALVELAVGRAVTRGILHLAGPERLSRHELATRVVTATCAEPEAALVRLRAGTRASGDRAADRPADVSLDGSRARAMLATRLRTVDEALARKDEQRVRVG